MDTEGCIVPAQDLIHLGYIPGFVAELENIAMSARESTEELIQSLGIHLPTGRKLKQDWPQPLFKLFDHGEEVVHGVLRVFELAIVCDVTAGFHSKAEVEWGLPAPQFQSGCLRQSIEAVVDLNGVEAL